MGIVPREHEEIFIDKLRVGWKQVLPAQAIHDMELSTYEYHSHLIEGMVLKLSTNILAEALPPEEIKKKEVLKYKTPKTWWDFFKVTYAESRWLGWIQRRWPAQWEKHIFEVEVTVNLKRYWAYPEASFVMAGNWGRAVKKYTLQDEVCKRTRDEGW